MSDNDDVLIGRLMSRREVLALFGVAGAALVVGCGDDGESPTPTSSATSGSTSASPTEGAVATATRASGASTTTVPACVVVPELTEGPYFVDEMLNRSDIRSEPTDDSVVAGDRLDVVVNVSQIGGDRSCTPLAGAQVDVWHCDAVGVYSGATDPGFDTSGLTWLRGIRSRTRTDRWPSRRSIPAGTRAAPRTFTSKSAPRTAKNSRRSGSSMTRSRTPCTHMASTPKRELPGVCRTRTMAFSREATTS